MVTGFVAILQKCKWFVCGDGVCLLYVLVTESEDGNRTEFSQLTDRFTFFLQ